MYFASSSQLKSELLYQNHCIVVEVGTWSSVCELTANPGKMSGKDLPYTCDGMVLISVLCCCEWEERIKWGEMRATAERAREGAVRATEQHLCVCLQRAINLWKVKVQASKCTILSFACLSPTYSFPHETTSITIELKSVVWSSKPK